MRKDLLKRLSKAKNTEDGFTLVEMVVAIMVLAVLALLAFPFFAKSMLIMDLNNTTTHAVVSMQAITEEIRANSDCSTIQGVVNRTNTYQDSRGMQYNVAITLPDACTNGELITIEMSATRAKDGKILASQQIQTLALSSGSYIEVTP